MTHGIADDVVGLVFGIAKVGQRFRNNAVDDLEVTAACKLLELNDSKVRFDPGGVTIHDKTDGACWCNHC